MTGHTVAKLRRLRMSPRKVRLVADLIRGMHASEAQVQLQFLNKKAARPVLKLLESAMANAAHNEQLKKETLVVEKIFVDGGPMSKRWQPRAFGRAGMLRKRTSHITIILAGEKEEEKKKVVKPKAEEKKVIEKKDPAKTKVSAEKKKVEKKVKKEEKK